MRELIREGIEGRSVKATFLLYVGSLVVLSPVAALIWLLFGYDTLFRLTPFLVAGLVAITYAYCYLPRLLSSDRKYSSVLQNRLDRPSKHSLEFTDASQRKYTTENR
jgi:hypothetical protein